MSRQTAQRTLTLTEELERLEQQITLTLQEIDSNFSKAHRIVTSSILPVVEDYARHSNDVWESSKYWKQFFEAAANVSLSGYEEAAIDDEGANTAEHTATDLTTPNQQRQNDAVQVDNTEEDFTIDSPTQISGMQSTPKLGSSGPRTARHKADQRHRSPSPRKYTGTNPHGDEPSTPDAQASDFSSPFHKDSATKPAGNKKRSDNIDPVLHRSVLDKNYRVLSTPFSGRAQARAAADLTPATAKKTPWDDSPDSSPVMDAPQLRSDLFSPAKNNPAPRTPGVSVQRPARNNTITSTGRILWSKEDKAAHTDEQRPMYNFSRFDLDGDDDDDDTLGMSPPKTLQFHVPQSRLLQTPAREASKKIVEDLLHTAGMAEDTSDEMDISAMASPSIIRGRQDDNDTF